MTDNQIINILQDLTNKQHKYSDAQYIFAVNYAITKIRSYNAITRMYKTLAMECAEYAKKKGYEIPYYVPDNY